MLKKKYIHKSSDNSRTGEWRKRNKNALERRKKTASKAQGEKQENSVWIETPIG